MHRLALIALVVGCRGAPAPPGGGAAVAIVGESTKLRAEDARPATSAIFDGTTVRLRGARGEVLGLQVVRAAGEPSALDLALDGAAVRRFAVAHHHVTRPSTAMYGPSRGPGHYPDELIAADGAAPLAGPAYFEVAIARDAAPGLHRGALTVGGDRHPVELTVDAFTLPDLAAAPRVWGYYDPTVVGDRAEERRYAALFRAHGVAVSPELTPATWADRQDAVAGLRFVPALLPREPDALAADVRWWAATLAGTGQVAFAIPIDEPRSTLAQAAVRVKARLVRAAGGGPGRFLYAVTHEPTPLLPAGGDVDVFIAPGAPPGGWTYNGTRPAAGAMILDTDGAALRSWGWIGFVRDTPLWYVWDVLFWADRYHRGRGVRPGDLHADPVTFDDGEDHGNLDGALAHPGVHGSLRLEALRRGLQDRALLDGLAACAGRDAALAVAAAVVPALPTDEAAWEAARRRVLDGLTACGPGLQPR